MDRRRVRQSKWHSHDEKTLSTKYHDVMLYCFFASAVGVPGFSATKMRVLSPRLRRGRKEQEMKAFPFPIAAGLLAAATVMTATAGPLNAAASQSASSPATASTKDSRALLNQRLRKCKAMSGDEKKACEKDAHSAAETKAHKEASTSGK
jgi:hypothetical protein